MGKLVDATATTVFLARQDRNYIVRAGDTIDGMYRVETVGDDALEFLFLPLKAKLTLPLTAPAAPAPAAAAAQPRKRVPDDDDD